MCGIIGVVSDRDFNVNDALKMLKKLEYRGYDSFGVATNTGLLEKRTGSIKNIDNVVCRTAIAHTRWATHGAVNETNAHPHTDCSQSVFVVHNGIIENYEEMKKELHEKGCCFASETDSEVIAHFFEKEPDVLKAVEKFFSIAEGNFAVVLLKKGDEKLYAFKRGSPLCLGFADGQAIISSDVYAFSEKTQDVIFFNEEECAVVSSQSLNFYRFERGILVETKREITKIKKPELKSNNIYKHYMIKEIKEESEALARMYDSIKNEQKESLDAIKSLIEKSKRVVFVSSGSSYHATLLGVVFLNRAGIEAHTIIASEFRNFYLIDKDTLIIAVTQSGETMDVINALHGMKDRGARIASIVNVPYSTVQRMGNVSLDIEAGQETCVASTKTFVNQVAVLAYMASLFGYEFKTERVIEAINKVFLQEDKIKKLALELKEKKDVYIIGRGVLYPVAREIALKLKEISYIHAEGMMAGELKHGTLALIENGTPVLSLMNKNNREIFSNAKEVECRGGDIISFSNYRTGFNKEIFIDTDCDVALSIAAAVAGQLLTYYIALEKGLPIDKPRNLAKCVTVK